MAAIQWARRAKARQALGILTPSERVALWIVPPKAWDMVPAARPEHITALVGDVLGDVLADAVSDAVDDADGEGRSDARCWKRALLIRDRVRAGGRLSPDDVAWARALRDLGEMGMQSDAQRLAYSFVLPWMRTAYWATFFQ